jgi:hypothetical protein
MASNVAEKPQKRPSTTAAAVSRWMRAMRLWQLP